MRKTLLLVTFAVVVIGSAVPAHGGEETIISVAAGASLPAGTLFNGVAVQSLDAGLGIEAEDGSALGQFCVVLHGVVTTPLGVTIERTITVEGKATSGLRSAPNAATVSGTCSIDMGNGTPLTLNVPFTATLAVAADDKGTIGLSIGATNLPSATVNDGTMTISVPPVITP
jgi:hypothetical protein